MLYCLPMGMSIINKSLVKRYFLWVRVLVLICMIVYY